MDLYVTSLLLGAAGLAAMAFSGLGHRGHGAGAGHTHAGSHGHGHMPSHAGHGAARGSGHGSTAGANHGHAGATRGHAVTTAAATHGARDMAARTLWSVTSPRFIFSALLGFGATGELVRPMLAGPLLLAVALGGAVLFERVLVTPLWNFAMRFASVPARTLESAVSDEATAVTSFDENGNGIVSLEVDGQVVQILATLQSGDRSLGMRVRAGQRVRIDEVDAEQNRCTVSVL